MSTIRNQAVVFQSYLSGDGSFNTDAQLGVNLNNTPMLTEMPTTTTSSEGTYIFQSSKGKTHILNACGSKVDNTFDFVAVSAYNGPRVLADLSSTGFSIGMARLESNAIKFSGVDYKALVDTHTSQIAGLTNFDVLEVVKIADLEAVDRALTARIVINESDITGLKAKDVLHESRLSSLEYQDTLELGRIGVLETDVAKAKQDILNLAAVDVTELAKLSDLKAQDDLFTARFIVDEAKIDSLEKKQPMIITQPIYHVPSVYADSQQMIDYIPAAVSAATPYSGFYYKNEVNKKVNWYLAGSAGMKVKDIKGLMLNFYNVSSISGLGCPFFSAYTKKDNLTPNAGSWYKSRRTYAYDYTASATASTAYALLADLKSLPYSPIAWNHTKVASSSIPGNDKGTFDDEEEIMFFSVGTSSNSAAGLFEFIASKFTIFTSDSSYEYIFQQK
jgi:hypothetical protein